MKIIIAIILIAVGAWLVYSGYQLQDSLNGSWDSVSNKVASSVDGKARVTSHVWYYIGGTICILAGLGSFALSRKKS